MFIKPGPAISTSEKSVIFFNKIFLIFSAISLGFVLFFFPKTNAILDEKSKLKFSGGFSRIIFLKSSLVNAFIIFLFFKTSFCISFK